MTTEQWQKVKEVYDEVVASEAAEWPAQLAALCADSEVRAEVEQLMGLQVKVSEFLEHSPLLDVALPSGQDQTGKQVGAYSLLRVIGRGGMGTVYLAERADDVHRKHVAVKLVWPGFDSAEIFKRFRQERHILAELDHPNIARLLDGGTTDEGWSYVVMEYVDGEPLTHYCNQHKLSVTERLKLFQQVCAAVSYAHRNLVVHRDLKPSNILVTKDGTAKLLDFGIAKILDPALRPDALSLTNTGMQAMTPEYASPEQVRGETITTATDVYSLGVLLYELLTGHQPYRFEKRMLHEVMRVIAEQEPLRPSHVLSTGFSRKSLLTTLPAEAGTQNTFDNAQETTPDKLRRCLQGDLDNIILKALRKEPEHRYSSVEQFSEDITRHLSGETVSAQAPTFTYRAGKFVRRNKTGVAFASFVVLLLIGSLFYAVQQTRKAREQARQQRRELYASDLQKAYDHWNQSNLEQMHSLLARYLPQDGQEDLRGFEWRYLWRLAHGEEFRLPHEKEVIMVNFTDFPHSIFTISGDAASTRGAYGTPVLTELVEQWWEGTRGSPLRQFTVGIDGKFNWDPWLYTSSPSDRPYGVAITGNKVRVYEPESNQAIDALTDPEVQKIKGVFPLPGHEWVCTDTDDGVIKLWEWETNRLLAKFNGHALPIQRITGFDRNRKVFVISGNNEVKIWEIATARLLATLRLPSSGEGASAYLSADEKWFLLGVSNRLFLYDTSNWRLVAIREMGKKTQIKFYIFGDRIFVYGADSIVRILHVPTLRQIGQLVGHKDWVVRVGRSTDGLMLVTASDDRTIRLWDARTFAELAVVRAHSDNVREAQFFQNDEKLYSIGADRTVKIWDVAKLLAPASIPVSKNHVYRVDISPDAQRLATASQDGKVQVWEAATGRLLKALPPQPEQVFSVAFSTDGKLLAATGESAVAKVWNAATGEELFTLRGHARQIHELNFSPDSRILVTVSDDKTIKLWDMVSGQELRTLHGHLGAVHTVAFSPDGKQLATGGEDKEIKLWNTATSQSLASFPAHVSRIWSLQFTYDGKQLVSGGEDRTAKLWDVQTRQLLRTFTGHTDEIFAVALTPDGTRLATASNDHTIKLWNLATGQELLTLNDHTDQVWYVTFSPDGQTLASASWDGTVRLYRAATEQEVQAKLPMLNPAKK